MPSITCDQCGKSFRWTAALAGRSARCTCGSIIQCPTDPPPDEAAYELATEPQKPARHDVAAPLVGAAQSKPVLGYQSAPIESAKKAAPETIKNLYMPMWLLGGGVFIEIIAAFITQPQSILGAMMALGFHLIFGTAFMLVGILLAAKFRGISFGAFWIAIFKLAAISVAPAALVAIVNPLLDHIPFGGLIGWIAEFVLYFALLGALFDLDESDTWYCVWVIFLVHLAAYFLLLWATAKWG